jgi:murein DD-endopeptidase MepM/ murein hydrolase activator NlpD
MEKFYALRKGKLTPYNISKLKIPAVIFGALILLSISMNFFNLFSALFPNSDTRQLKIENYALKNRVKALSNDFENLNNKLERLLSTNDELRLAVNLAPSETDELGIGGAVFGETPINSSSDINELLTNIDSYINRISLKINYEVESYSEIEESMEENSNLFNCIPAIRPAKGYYGDRFGMRYHPILKRKRMHSGLDILSNIGEPVYATADGKVRLAGRNGGMGKMIRIDHGFGYKTSYAHLSKIKVKRGAKVKRGDLIGYSGNSGLSTGPHLHYEVHHNGIALNPRNFIYDDVKIFEIAAKE